MPDTFRLNIVMENWDAPPGCGCLPYPGLPPISRLRVLFARHSSSLLPGRSCNGTWDPHRGHCHSASWHQMICTWRKCEILLLFLFARGSFAPSCCTTQLCEKLLSITLHLHLQSTSWRWGPIRGSAEVSPWPAVLGKSWDEALQSEAHKSSL